MIKKLQLKFVLITMLSLLLVLAVIIVGMNIVSYHNVVADADELLELLSEHKGGFPEFGAPFHKLPKGMSPEIPYESRYFTVTVDEDSGKVLAVDTGRIAAVDAGDAADYTARAKGDHGFVEDFRYVRQDEDGQQRFIFLDCGRRLDAFRDFLFASVSISLAGYILVFLLVLFLSDRMVRPISDSYEKQKRFITDAGHELKTPLTIIRADADILTMDLGDNEWLSDILKQTDRMSSLTNDLVYLARMEEGGIKPVMIEFPLSDVVSEAAQSFLALSQTQGKTFTMEITPMLSMCGDGKAMTQLVSILLDNALKYSPTGGSIHLTLEKQAKGLCISVTNTTHETLSKDCLGRLFDRFYRGDGSRSGTGHGIGLSVARAIVQNHGGRITAETPSERELRISAIFPR